MATGHTAAPARLHRRGLGLRAAAALAAGLMTATLAGAWAPAVLAAGGSISGTVRDTSGAPLSGIAVQAGTIVSGGFTATPGASTTTSGSGTYTVSVSTTGRYAIRFIDATQAHASGYYSSSGFVPDAPRATVILISGTVTGVNASLPATRSISGTVTGAGGLPVQNISVDAVTTSGANVLTSPASVKTSASGTYTIKLAPGSYKLRFTDATATYPTVYYTTTGVTTDLSAASTLVLSSSNLTGKDVQLPTARLITGTVTNASAAPVAGLEVSAGLASDITDGSGAYSLSVPAGQYLVTVVDPTNALPGGYISSGAISTDPATAAKVDVTGGNAVANVQLPAGSTVSGTVTDTGGTGLAGIEVWLTPVGAVDPLAIVTTSGSGAYSIVAASGTYTVKLQDPTARYTSGFYRQSVASGFTKDLSVATHVSVPTAALSPVRMPLYNTVDRQSGADRYATAANISRGTVPSGAPVVYIATALNFPDALAAAAAAGQEGGPVLLVAPTSIPTVVKTELTRLKPKKIVIAGGTSVVSAGVATQLGSYTNPTGNVSRQSGANRYATAAAISAATFDPGAHVAYIATGLNFPDALAAAAAAGRLGGPVLLVPGTSIPNVVKNELLRLQPERIIIAGGTSVVSASVATQLAGFTTGTVTRQSVA